MSDTVRAPEPWWDDEEAPEDDELQAPAPGGSGSDGGGGISAPDPASWGSGGSEDELTAPNPSGGLISSPDEMGELLDEITPEANRTGGIVAPAPGGRGDEGGRWGIEPLNLADPRFAELREVQRRLAEMQASLDAGEVSLGEEFQGTAERTELHNRLWELQEELKADYGLSDFELRNLVIPSEYPWLARADADPITAKARELHARIKEIEYSVRLAREEGEDTELTEEMMSVALEYESYVDALVDTYGITDSEAQQLTRVPADLSAEQRMLAFTDPGGLAGLASGFIEGLTTDISEWGPSANMSTWGGRLVGSQIDSFMGAIEPLMLPWQMTVNTISNFNYLQENMPKDERGGIFTTVSTARNVGYALALNDSWTYSVIPQMFGIETPLMDLLPSELRDRGSRYAVNLQHNRAVDLAAFMPDLRANAIGLKVGKHAGILTEGVEVLDELGLFERLNIENPVAQELIGAAFDFVADPLFFADFLFAGSKIMRAAGARRAAHQTAEAAEKVRRAMTPRGVFDAAWRNLDDPMHPAYYTGGRTAEQTAVMTQHGARSIPHRVLESLGHTIDNFANIEVPIGSNFTRQTLGISSDDVTRIPMRYFWFTEGVLDLPLPNIRNLPQELTGGPMAGPGVRERAIGVSRAYVRSALEGASVVRDIIQAPVVQYRTLNLGNLKIQIPGIGVQLDRTAQGYVRTMNELVWDFVDNVGIPAGRRILPDDIIPPPIGGVRAELGDNVVRYSMPPAFDPLTADWYEMARNIGRAFDVPEEVATTSFRHAVRQASEISAALGYQLADYETYVSMMRKAADNLTERTGRSFDPQFMRTQVEAYFAGMDVDAFVRQGDFVPLSFVDEVAPAPPRSAPAQEVPDFVVFMDEGRLLLDDNIIGRYQSQLDAARALPDSTPEKALAIDFYEGQIRDYEALMGALGSDGSGWRQLPDSQGVFWERIPEMTAPDLITEGPEWFRYDMDDFEMFRREVKFLFSTEGNPFAHLDPEVYLSGLRDGYLRRTFGAKIDPDTIAMRIQMRDIVLFPSSVTHDGLIGRVQSAFGDGAAEAVGTYLAGRTENQIMFTEELFDVISRAAGIELPGEMNVQSILTSIREAYGSAAENAARAYLSKKPLPQGNYTDAQIVEMISTIGREGNPAVGRWNLVNDVIYGDDFDYEFLKRTMALLNEEPRTQRGVGGPSGFDPTMTPGAFSARQQLSPDQRTMLVQLKDAPAALSALASRGARAIRSQTMLRDVYNFFRENHLLYSIDDLNNLEVNRRFNFTQLKRLTESSLGADSWRQIWDHEAGRYWVQIPNNANQWGTLAGSVVPRDIGRWLMLMSSSAPDTMPSFVRNGLNLFRRLQLAPSPTVMRNMYGQFVIAQQSGIDLVDMISNLPRAWAARNEYLATGSSPIMGGGEKAIGFFEDVNLSSQVRNQVQQMVDNLARPDVIERLRNLPPGQAQLEEIGRIITDGLDAAARRPFPRIGEAVTFEGTTAVSRAAAWVGNNVLGQVRIPSLGMLDLFTQTEEVTRAAIYLSVMDNAIANGVPREQAVRMGAHAGNHAVNNYANVPLVVSALRNTGLSLFPAFSYLQFGRTARAMWQNPQALAKQQHFIQGASNVLGAGMTEEERELAMERMPDYLRGQPGIWVSERLFGGESDRYLRVPMDKIFPMGFADMLQYGEEVAMLGAWSPLIDAAMAFIKNDGVAPSASQYGRGRVFEDTDGFLTRLTKTFGWLAESFAPGQYREIKRFTETVGEATGPWFDPMREQVVEHRDTMAAELGRYSNRDPSQFIVRQLGFATYIVDTNERDSVSDLARDRSIEARANALRQSITRQARAIEAKWPRNHPEYQPAMDELERRFTLSLRAYANSMDMPWEEAERLFGDIYEEFR